MRGVARRGASHSEWARDVVAGRTCAYGDASIDNRDLALIAAVTPAEAAR